MNQSTLISEITKIDFYFDLIDLLENCYDYRTGLGSSFVNVKEQVVEGFKFAQEAISKNYAKYEAVVEAYSKEMSELEKITEPEVLRKRIDEFSSIEPSESKRKLMLNRIFPNEDEHIQKQFDQAKQQIDHSNLDLSLSKIFGLMNQMLTDETEKELLRDREAWKKALDEGDIQTLRRLNGIVQEQGDYTSGQVKKIAERVMFSVNQKISSLYILPLSVVTENVNLIDRLRTKGIYPKQVVRNLPNSGKANGLFFRIMNENGVEVGHLLGTIHVANETMLKLNPAMRTALEKARSISLEVIPNRSSPPPLEVTFPNNLDEEKRKKLENFIHLLFPKILLSLTEEGLTTRHLNSLQMQFSQANLEKRLNLCFGLIGNLGLKIAHVVHMDTLSLFASSIPVGIDHLLAEFALTKGKELLGMEKDDAERTALILQAMNHEYISDAVIAGLPTTKEEVNSFISKKINEASTLCEAWTKGDSEFLNSWADKYKSNPDFYSKFIAVRDMIMADSVDQTLGAAGQGTFSFFGMGAAHVPGVISLLERKRWRFERINN